MYSSYIAISSITLAVVLIFLNAIQGRRLVKRVLFTVTLVNSAYMILLGIHYIETWTIPVFSRVDISLTGVTRVLIFFWPLIIVALGVMSIMLTDAGKRAWEYLKNTI